MPDFNTEMADRYKAAHKPWPPDYTPTDWVREIIGGRYRSMGKFYTCTAYDPRMGFWMVAEEEPWVTNISERAIDRTYHRVREAKPLAIDYAKNLRSLARMSSPCGSMWRDLESAADHLDALTRRAERTERTLDKVRDLAQARAQSARTCSEISDAEELTILLAGDDHD